VRTAAERDELTLLIVRAVVRFVAVVAGAWCLLAAIDLAVGIDRDAHVPLALGAVGLGVVAAVARLRRGAREVPGLRFDGGSEPSDHPGRPVFAGQRRFHGVRRVGRKP
jgi:hypothetical protein